MKSRFGDLTVREFQVLRILKLYQFSAHYPTTTEIAKDMDSNPSTVSEFLKNLMARRYARRIEKVGTAQPYALTKKGMEASARCPMCGGKLP